MAFRSPNSLGYGCATSGKSWHGQVLHDSWQDPGRPEAVPTGSLGDEVFGAVLRAHQGDIIEIVLAAEPENGNESSVVVLSLDNV